jgi:enoyl-CoA hydratase/carnithine racemase
MADRILRRHDGAVLTLELDEPERRNPLSGETIADLMGALDDVRGDPGVRAVVLGARGPAFSAGHDLREMHDRDAAFYAELFGACSELMLTMHRLPQPIVARVQGVAAAAGCQLVAACDLAVAAEGARFSTPGTRIGLFCTTPMVEVARAVGRKRAMELLLTGELIDAATALEWGLVNRVVPAEELDRTAAELAARVAEASGIALGMGKRAFYESVDGDAAARYAHASEVMTENALAPDAREGIEAFLDKREPVWTHAPAEAPHRVA